MPSPTQSEPSNEATPPTSKRPVITAPDFSGTPQPIRELAGREDFPHCAYGVYIDIQGFAGVVVEIIAQSIKVRPSEGMTQRFNVNRLKVLFAPEVRPEPVAVAVTARADDRPVAIRRGTVEERPARPERTYVSDPDFTASILPINAYAGQPDFPKCAYGKHVEIEGYTGVVVEFVKSSLKIRSAAGTTRSYNAEVLRKNYGSP